MYNLILFIITITIGLLTLLVGIYQAYKLYKFYKAFIDHLEMIDTLHEEGYKVTIL